MCFDNRVPCAVCQAFEEGCLVYSFTGSSVQLGNTGWVSRAAASELSVQDILRDSLWSARAGKRRRQDWAEGDGLP